MFFISIPEKHKIGDTVDCRINQKPVRLTWRDPKTLVIEPNDARAIVSISIDGGLIHFVCGDRGVAVSQYEVEGNEGGVIISERPA
jgi:hypothetical protein